jgi:predicted GTPase
MTGKEAEKIIIMGAAGRDFHDFNTFFRGNEPYRVVGFTAAQIPDIAGRRYPPALAGDLYPDGIPIYDEKDLPSLVKENAVDAVYLSYSDLSHEDVMHKASLVLSCGADFRLLGPEKSMLKSTKPVVAVCAVRTGCGKSQTSRKVVEHFKNLGKNVVAVRHPMPYGDLERQAVQRFAAYEDLEKHDCTIEEREEYEPYISKGLVVYAGVDYEKILRQAEQEADVIIWDGGNNDLPFFRPDLHIVVADPHRAGHEIRYHPGEANLRMADVVVVNKVNTAEKEDIDIVLSNIEAVNPDAAVIKADSLAIVDNDVDVSGKKVIVVEDGPTLTHGEMRYGIAWIAAEERGATILDAAAHAVGSIKELYTKYPHLDKVLPAMGYGTAQMKELTDTINATDCDVVVAGTPIDLGRLLKIDKPIVQVGYELDDETTRKIGDLLGKIVKG